MPALNHSNMYSKTTLLRLGAQKRGKRREDGTGVSKSQELETLICLVHVSLLQREYVYLAAGTTSVQRLKVRAPLNDVTNVRPSKAQCATKVGKNDVICPNDLQKAIPLRATSSTTNLQTLSNGSTGFCQCTAVNRTTHQQSQCPIPNLSDDLGRNLQAEADTNLPIRRSQRLTFQKGKAVVNSQQFIIDNIQNDKVVSMSALTGK
nr:hypothetical protein Iba_chr07cCG2170 [Ipomoea batatas]